MDEMKNLVEGVAEIATDTDVVEEAAKAATKVTTKSNGKKVLIAAGIAAGGYLLVDKLIKPVVKAGKNKFSSWREARKEKKANEVKIVNAKNVKDIKEEKK